MQEVVIPNPVAAIPRPFLKRPLIILGLIIASAGLIIGSFWLVQQFFAPIGNLQVTSLQTGAEVRVGGSVVGLTDYRGSLRPGSYFVEVSSASRSAKPWKGQVNIQSSALSALDLDLGPSAAYSGSTIFNLERGSGLIVNSTPGSARVYLDGTEIGKTPLTRPTPSPGNHTLKLTSSSYLDKEIQIVITNGWKLSVAVTLFQNPDFGVTLSSQASIVSSPVSELAITPRSELGLDKILGPAPVSSYTAWSKAELWSLSAPDSSLSPSEWLRGLYYHAVVHLLLPDLPFQYLIDPTGKIYEGRSGGDFVTTTDVSSGLLASSQAPVTRPGVVEVGYLGSKDVAPAASESFRKLVKWLGQPPKLAGTPPTLTDLTLESGKQTEVSLRFHNTGFATWSNFGDLRVLLGTTGRSSVFYTSSSWVDSTHPATPTETYVPSGSDATFKFVLTAPGYGGDFDETFNLTQGVRVVEGTEVHLKVHVAGPSKPTPQVKIDDTGVGFLRVRSGAGIGFSEIARVTPGETYELISEQTGWYQIKLKDGRTGWISSQFATKI